ncbi:hypothetical protein BZA77DRAFT_297036 [Pyronema omphalodes]|nr:hypothetical protein BZA77DRAFT_297036 [Pyronema omphalodes]
MAPLMVDTNYTGPFPTGPNDRFFAGPPISLDDFLAQYSTASQFLAVPDPFAFYSSGQPIPQSPIIAEPPPVTTSEHFDLLKYTFKDAGATLYDLSKPIPLIENTKGAHIAVSKAYNLTPGRCMVKLNLPIDIGMPTERIKQYTVEVWEDDIEHLGLKTKVYGKKNKKKDGRKLKERVKNAKVVKKPGFKILPSDAVNVQMPKGYRRRGRDDRETVMGIAEEIKKGWWEFQERKWDQNYTYDVTEAREGLGLFTIPMSFACMLPSSRVNTITFYIYNTTRFTISYIRHRKPFSYVVSRPRSITAGILRHYMFTDSGKGIYLQHDRSCAY